jgi:uncharacterized membrane protein YhaH (DUF805 family)
MFGVGVAEVAIIAIIGLIIVLPSWKIFTKAGFSGWLAVLMVVPIVNILVEYYVAFSDWPLSRENRQLKNAAAGRHVS